MLFLRRVDLKGLENYKDRYKKYGIVICNRNRISIEND